jgi:hypothetical protein
MRPDKFIVFGHASEFLEPLPVLGQNQVQLGGGSSKTAAHIIAIRFEDHKTVVTVAPQQVPNRRFRGAT